MLRAAPGSRATRRLSRGMVAYHLELFAVRRRAPTVRVRAMGLRNLAVAGAIGVAGLAASALPRRPPAPLDVVAVD